MIIPRGTVLRDEGTDREERKLTILTRKPFSIPSAVAHCTGSIDLRELKGDNYPEEGLIRFLKASGLSNPEVPDRATPHELAFADALAGLLHNSTEKGYSQAFIGNTVYSDTFSGIRVSLQASLYR